MTDETTPFRPRIVEHAMAFVECGAIERIREGIAILHAIDQGGLLEELPEDAGAQTRHEAAVTMLGILEERLRQALEREGDGGVATCTCKSQQSCRPGDSGSV